MESDEAPTGDRVRGPAMRRVVALVAAGYGVAILPSNARVPRGVRTVPLVHRGGVVGRWAHIAWDQRRFLPPYGGWFVEEIVAYCRRDYPGRDLIRRAPKLPRPKENTG